MERQEATTRDFDSVKGPILQQLTAQKRQQVLDRTADELFKKYNVKIHEQVGEPGPTSPAK
jgi:hypothetical protein